MRDWRKAIFQQPITYKMGNSTVRLQSRLVVGLAIAAGVVLLYLLLRPGFSAAPPLLTATARRRCNTTYPLSRPVAVRTGSVRYRVAIVSDLDTASRHGAAWRSILRRGTLIWDARREAADVEWDDDITMTSSLSQGGRAMELSELVVFDGHLLSVDDRTGVVYRLTSGQAVPWVILADGDGAVAKGFKGEWMAVKDEHLYIGGLGKEWTTSSGEVLNHNPQFVKRVSCAGAVEHLDWRPHYQRLRLGAGLQPPGYLIHEAAAWSRHHRQWMFLPRRASQERYDDLADERRGTNLLLRADETFSDVQVSLLGPLVASHGFSSFKFVPDTDDQWLVALKSEEDSLANSTASYVTVLSLDGRVAMSETRLPGHVKFEGIEFV